MAGRDAETPLVGDGRSGTWVDTGTKVWNGTIIVLSCIFMVEASIFLVLGVKAPSLNPNATDYVSFNASTNTTMHSISQGGLEFRLGIALVLVAAGMAVLAYTQCMECCFNRQIMRIFYFAFCVMLVLYELLLVYIIVLIEQWDVFKGDVDSYEIGTLTQTLKDCMWLLVPELIISVFMQIGAMGFNCSQAEQLRLKAMENGDYDAAGSSSCCCGGGNEENEPGARYQKLFKTFSGGKSNVKLGPKHVQRLESMRSYYAQLYMENGLDVPTELADEDTRRRREFRQRQQRK